MDRILASLALAMFLAQSTGALAAAGIDLCATPCPGQTQDGACPPGSSCCACCATPQTQAPPAASLLPTPAVVRFGVPTAALAAPAAAPQEISHVPRSSAA